MNDRRPAETESGAHVSGRRSWRDRLRGWMATSALILRKEWELLRDPDASWIRGLRFEDRVPVALPARPTESGSAHRVATRGTVREIRSAAREMEEEGNWYSALDLYLELVRRTEESRDQEVDVALYNRIAELHRKLTLEWYVEAADRYAVRGLNRGAMALCEKALHLDPDQHHVRLRLRRFLKTANGVAEEVDEGSDAPEGTEAAPADVSAGDGAADREAAPKREDVASAGARVDEPPIYEIYEAPGPERDRASADAEPEPELEPERTPADFGPRLDPEPVSSPAARTAPEPSGAAPATDVEPPPHSDRWSQLEEEPLPDRIVVPPADDEYEGLRRRARRVIAGAGAALLALIIALLVVL